MATQTQDGYRVNFKVETAEGTAAAGGASTGEELRTTASPGFNLRRGVIQSAEVRNDANAAPVRLGAKRGEGSYNFELSQGSFATIIEAVMRSTWVADTAITYDNSAGLTSLTVDSSSQITSIGTTTLLTSGLRAGDVFRLTNMSTTANNDVNCRVKSIDATGLIITLHGTPLTTQGADTACTLTILKKLTQATTPTRRTFTIEQYYEDVDLTEYMVGCRFTSLRMQMQPNGMVNCTVGFIGLDRTTLANGTSPYFTSPTTYTSIALVATDATITYNGTAVTKLSSFDVSFEIAAEGAEVIGSVTMPGTYDNTMRVTGTVSGLFEDFANVVLYDAETEFAMHVLLVEPESEPKSMMAFYFPAVLITDIDKSLGGNSAMIETKAVNFQPKVAASGHDGTVVTISTSA